MKTFFRIFAAISILGSANIFSAVTGSHEVLFFDSSLAMQQSLEGQKIVADLNAEVARLQEKAQAMEKELKADEEMIMKQSALMTPEKLNERKLAHNQKIKDIQRQREDFGEQLNAKMQMEQEKLFGKQIKIAVQVCKDKGGKALLDRRLPGVHFSSEELDITSEAIVAIDAAYKKELEAEKKNEAEKKGSSKKGA